MTEFKCSIEPCITPEYAADLLQVSVYTIKRWLRQGDLDGFKLPGNQWRTTEEACKKLIEKGRNS